MMRTPSYCRAASAVKRIISLSRQLENVWFPVIGWQETINILENEDFTITTVTKAFNSIIDQNPTFEENKTLYRIRHNKKLIVVERGVDGKSK